MPRHFAACGRTSRARNVKLTLTVDVRVSSSCVSAFRWRISEFRSAVEPVRGIKNILWFLWGIALSAIIAAVLQVTPASAQTRARTQVAPPVPIPSAAQASAPRQPARTLNRANADGETRAEIEDAETGASSAEPVTDEPDADGAANIPGMRPTVQDGDPVVMEPQPTDGVAEVGEPQMPPDGVDPTRFDTRPAEEAQAFEVPPSPFDQLAFQIEDLDPILDRRPARLARFEPYDPVGIKAGQFVIFPEVEVAGLATRNAQLSPNPRADVAIETRPSVRVVSNWRRHAIEFRANGNFSGYNELSSENNKGYHLETRGRIDVTRRTNVQLELSRDVSQESRQVLEAALSGGRADVTVDELRGSFNHRFNRLSVQLRGSVSDIAYGAVDTDGVVATNGDRDYMRTTQDVRATWEFKPTLLGFTEVGLDQRGFKTTSFSDGISRSSKGERYKVGISLGNTGAILRGEASLGWGRQRPDDSRLQDVSGVLVDANVAWRVTALTSAIFTARTDLASSTITGTAGSVSRTGGLEVRHQFRQNLIASAGISYTVNGYSGLAIEERDLRGTLGLEYFVNRDTVLFGRYQHTAFDTTSPSGDYSNDEIRVGVRLRR